MGNFAEETRLTSEPSEQKVVSLRGALGQNVLDLLSKLTKVWGGKVLNHYYETIHSFPFIICYKLNSKKLHKNENTHHFQASTLSNFVTLF